MRSDTITGLDVAPVAPQARFSRTKSGSTESSHSFVPVATRDLSGAAIGTSVILRKGRLGITVFSVRYLVFSIGFGPSNLVSVQIRNRKHQTLFRPQNDGRSLTRAGLTQDERHRLIGF